MKDEAAWGKWEESRKQFKPHSLEIPKSGGHQGELVLKSYRPDLKFAPPLCRTMTLEHLLNSSENQFQYLYLTGGCKTEIKAGF